MLWCIVDKTIPHARPYLWTSKVFVVSWHLSVVRRPRARESTKKGANTKNCEAFPQCRGNWDKNWFRNAENNPEVGYCLSF